jgi:hypothetical protein
MHCVKATKAQSGMLLLEIIQALKAGERKMKPKKMYGAGECIENIAEIDQAVTNMEYLMIRTDKGWHATHPAFIMSMRFNTIKSMIKNKRLAYAIKN